MTFNIKPKIFSVSNRSYFEGIHHEVNQNIHKIFHHFNDNHLEIHHILRHSLNGVFNQIKGSDHKFFLMIPGFASHVMTIHLGLSNLGETSKESGFLNLETFQLEALFSIKLTQISNEHKFRDYSHFS